MTVVAPGIAIGLLLVYGGALWWLLRREPAAAFVGIAALCSVALATRIWYTSDFPTGLIEDEPKFLGCAGRALQDGRLFGESCIGIPTLLGAVFGAQAIPLVGPTRWAMRGYSMVTSILAVAAAYAVGRALGLRVFPSLIISAAVAGFPWAIFFGRISLGGELVFHELLVVAALARLIWATGGWVEAAFGGVALCALLYDYFVGRTMVGFTVVAVVLARGRYRLWCLAILVIAFLGWLPHMLGPQQYAGLGLIPMQVSGATAENTLGRILDSAHGTLAALVLPVGRDDWFTIRSAAMHPTWFLALALLGSLTGVRRGLFLWAGFLGGLAPSIVSEGRFPSTHRMMMAYPFIAMAAACAVNLLPWRRIQGTVAMLVMAVGVTQGVRLYFSPEFWPAESAGVFEEDRAAVVESLPLPPHPPIILMKHLRYHFGPRMLSDDNHAILNADNWFPSSNAMTIYAFDRLAAPLRPFYERIVGPDRVRAFGRAFTVTTEWKDWSWLRQYGWTYEARCGHDVRRGQVPTLYHILLGFDSPGCRDPITHRWTGQWRGPTQDLQLYFNGAAEITTTHGVALAKEGYEITLSFVARPGDEIRITVVTPPPDPGVLAILTEVTPMGQRVPLLEHVAPVTAATQRAAN